MITALRVKNFRSLRNVSLQLGLRNIFVGPNLSGKSNILDVFRFFRDMLLVSDISLIGVGNAFTRRLGFSEVAWKGDDPGVISIGLDGKFAPTAFDQPYEALGSPTTWKYDITFAAMPNGWVTVQNEVLEFSDGSRRAKIIDTIEGKRQLFSWNGQKVSDVDDRSRSALEFEIPAWDGNRIRSMIRMWRFYGFIPSTMRTLNPTTAANALNEHGENLSAWLMTLQTRHRDAFDKLVQVVRDVFPELNELYAWTTEQATVFAVSKEIGLKRLTPVSQMSDGQLCFIAMASLILAPDELGVPLVCVEEPENYLHPKLMETLVTLLNQRQDELGVDRAAQLLITTHSPHVIDRFSLDDLIVVQKREGTTVCTRPREKKHLRDLLAREEAGLGQLYYSGALS